MRTPNKKKKKKNGHVHSILVDSKGSSHGIQILTFRLTKRGRFDIKKEKFREYALPNPFCASYRLIGRTDAFGWRRW